MGRKTKSLSVSNRTKNTSVCKAEKLRRGLLPRELLIGGPAVDFHEKGKIVGRG